MSCFPVLLESTAGDYEQDCCARTDSAGFEVVISTLLAQLIISAPRVRPYPKRRRQVKSGIKEHLGSWRWVQRSYLWHVGRVSCLFGCDTGVCSMAVRYSEGGSLHTQWKCSVVPRSAQLKASQHIAPTGKLQYARNCADERREPRRSLHEGAAHLGSLHRP